MQPVNPPKVSVDTVVATVHNQLIQLRAKEHWYVNPYLDYDDLIYIVDHHILGTLAYARDYPDMITQLNHNLANLWIAYALPVYEHTCSDYLPLDPDTPLRNRLIRKFLTDTFTPLYKP